MLLFTATLGPSLARADIGYGYDADGELVCVTDASGNQRGFQYDQVGNLVQILSSCSGLGMVSGAGMQAAPNANLTTGATTSPVPGNSGTTAGANPTGAGSGTTP